MCTWTVGLTSLQTTIIYYCTLTLYLIAMKMDVVAYGNKLLEMGIVPKQEVGEFSKGSS